MWAKRPRLIQNRSRAPDLTAVDTMLCCPRSEGLLLSLLSWGSWRVTEAQELWPQSHQILPSDSWAPSQPVLLDRSHHHEGQAHTILPRTERPFLPGQTLAVEMDFLIFPCIKIKASLWHDHGRHPSWHIGPSSWNVQHHSEPKVGHHFGWW